MSSHYFFVFDQEVKIHLKKNVGHNDRLESFACMCVCVHVCDELIDLKKCKINKKSQTLDYWDNNQINHNQISIVIEF
jgi:hypothetical protein